ncbi:hypothetical protein C4569_02250 [Candidatus Parcubacteria bacterium]|nr:MAG: hypothetical protein C4569_02250 [Candidatus Parcubacteria bacterium]
MKAEKSWRKEIQICFYITIGILPFVLMLPEKIVEIYIIFNSSWTTYAIISFLYQKFHKHEFQVKCHRWFIIMEYMLGWHRIVGTMAWDPHCLYKANKRDQDTRTRI